MPHPYPYAMGGPDPCHSLTLLRTLVSRAFSAFLIFFSFCITFPRAFACSERASSSAFSCFRCSWRSPARVLFCSLMARACSSSDCWMWYSLKRIRLRTRSSCGARVRTCQWLHRQNEHTRSSHSCSNRSASPFCSLYCLISPAMPRRLVKLNVAFSVARSSASFAFS